MLEKFKNLFTKSQNSYSLSTNVFNSRSLNDESFSYLNAYKLNLYVNKALDIRGVKVGQTEFYLYNPKTEEVIKDHPVINLLYKPNKYHSKTEFFNLLQRYKDVYGSAYIWLDGKRTDPFQKIKTISAMWVLPTNKVKEIVNKDTGEIEFYQYTKESSADTLIPASDVICVKHFDLANPMSGVSILQSGMREIKTGSQLTDYQAKILKNGGKIDGVFNFKNQERLTKEQLQLIKERYKQEYAEAEKSGMPLFMAGEADYKRVSLSPEELNYLESRKANLNDVCIMTGVPRSLLGSFDEIKFDNADVSYRIFLRETIKPETDTLVTKMNETTLLVPEGLELRYIDPAPEDFDRKLKSNENGIKNYYMTPNEARKNVGLDPIDGGDELYIPFSVMPREQTPADEPKTPPKKSDKAGRDIFMHPLKDKEIRRMYSKLYTKRSDRRESKFKSVLNDYFSEQSDRLIKKLTATKSFKKKDVLGELWNEDLEIKLGSEKMLPVMTEILIAAGIDAVELMQYDYNFNVSAGIKSWLDNKADIFSKQINETTFNKLKSEFQISLDAGETRVELSKRIKDTYKTISKARADVIARTEVHAVSQKGQFEAYVQMNVPIKIWVWSPGIKGGVRDEHNSMDGEERPLNTPFSNGQNMPGEGSAGDVINCQCSL